MAIIDNQGPPSREHLIHLLYEAAELEHRQLEITSGIRPRRRALATSPPLPLRRQRQQALLRRHTREARVQVYLIAFDDA